MNTYIQNKLDEFRIKFGQFHFPDRENTNPYHWENSDIEMFIYKSLTDYHNHIIEKISGMEKENIVDSINMSGEITTADMKIGFNQAISKIISLLQDTNPNE